MRVIAGSVRRGTYSIDSKSMSRLRESIPLNQATVESVEFIDAQTKGSAPKSGTGDVLIGGAIAGVPGMILGSLHADGDAALKKLATRRIVEFVIRFQDGRVAHCTGSQREYRRALQTVYSPPKLDAQDRIELALEADERHLGPEQNAEYQSRRQALLEQNLPFRKYYRLVRELDAEFGL